MSEPRVLICSRCRDEDDPVGEAMVAECCDCKTPVWVSQSSIEHAPDAVPMCMQCALPMMKAAQAAGDLKIEQPSEGQLKEIKEHLRRG